MSGSNLGPESGYPYRAFCGLSDSSQASAGKVQAIVARLIHSPLFINRYSVIILLI